MESRAPYQAETPKGPRNLSRELAAWLRTLGFTAAEYYGTTVAAHWEGSRGERFELSYEWVGGPSPDATCRLRVRHPGQALFEVLFTAQKVRRLKEARLLLLNNVCYYNARLLARPATPVIS